jgi:hypothetical protein
LSRFLWALAYATLFAGVLGAGGRHAGPAWELAALAVTLGYPLMVLVGVAHAVGTGVTRGSPTVGPLVVLLAALPGIPVMRAADGALHDRRFAHFLPQVQEVISRMPLAAGQRIRIPSDSLPAAIRHCCARLVVARRDSLGHVSATVFGQRNVAYLYDPSGERLARGLRLGRWESHRVLAADWYMVVRSQ